MQKAGTPRKVATLVSQVRTKTRKGKAAARPALRGSTKTRKGGNPVNLVSAASTKERRGDKVARTVSQELTKMKQGGHAARNALRENTSLNIEACLAQHANCAWLVVSKTWKGGYPVNRVSAARTKARRGKAAARTALRESIRT